MQTDIAKPMPHCQEAEQSVLGAVLLGESAIMRALPLLPDAAMFFIPQNREIYRAMQCLMASGTPIDAVSVIHELQRAGSLDRAGGAGYVSQLPDQLPRVTNVEHYARIVRDKFQLRQLIHIAERQQECAFAASEDPEVLAEQSISQLLERFDDREGAARARSWREVARSAVDQLVSEKLNPEKSARMFFGIKPLDEMTSGLRRKEVCEIVAPTSNGKSLLAMQLGMQSARDGFKVFYFSAEMPGEQLAMRELAYQAGVKFYFTQRAETLNTEELERLSTAALEETNLKIIDRDITPARVWAMAEAAKRTSGLDLVIVDYDQLVIEAGIDLASDDDSVFRHQRAFMLAAKRLAERLDVCVVLLCQLRKLSGKVADGATPRLDDIWGDSSVRNTPHLILWLVREFFRKNMDADFERKASVYVLKARNGRTGTVELEFDPERVRFLDPAEASAHPEQQGWWKK